MMALQEEFYGSGHKAVYDRETIALFLRTIGFTTVEEGHSVRAGSILVRTASGARATLSTPRRASSRPLRSCGQRLTPTGHEPAL